MSVGKEGLSVERHTHTHTPCSTCCRDKQRGKLRFGLIPNGKDDEPHTSSSLFSIQLHSTDGGGIPHLGILIRLERPSRVIIEIVSPNLMLGLIISFLNILVYPDIKEEI